MTKEEFHEKAFQFRYRLTLLHMEYDRARNEDVRQELESQIEKVETEFSNMKKAYKQELVLSYKKAGIKF